MICYHSPKDIIDSYGFHAELIAQTPTSMHGSKEGHTGYIYRRLSPSTTETATTTVVSCDPAFKSSHDMVNSGLESLRTNVNEIVDTKMNSKLGPRTRGARRG